jgi:hypothetical protein
MTFYILKKNIIFFRIFYEKNCLNKIMTIFMRIIPNTRKFLNFFEENIDDSTCRKTLKNTLFRAQNVLTKLIKHKFYELLQSLSIF